MRALVEATASAGMSRASRGWTMVEERSRWVAGGAPGGSWTGEGVGGWVLDGEEVGGSVLGGV